MKVDQQILYMHLWDLSSPLCVLLYRENEELSDKVKYGFFVFVKGNMRMIKACLLKTESDKSAPVLLLPLPVQYEQ